LCIDRHHLTNDKRNTWGLQHQLWKDNPQKYEGDIASLKKEIDNITKKIEEIDIILKKYGINEKNRPQIVKIIKAYEPEGWLGGFSEFN
jgi:hypothetical protein